MTNAISLLKEDHKKVKALLEELADTGDRATRKREQLLGEVALEITVHAALEEEIFYPAFLAAAKKKETETLYYEAQEEHKAAKVVLADLQRADPSTPSFHGKAKVLKELVLHHAKEEEDEMFPQARELLSKEELADLGAKMETRKQTLLAKQPNGAAPAQPKGVSL
jgi:hemerythrin superfamily protein